MKNIFRMRLVKGDEDVAGVLDALPDGEASQYVKDAIRQRVGVPTAESRLSSIEQKLEIVRVLIGEALAKLGG